MTGKPFAISRTLNAPPALVFTCFTTGDHMARWFGPKGCNITHSELDFREGGLYHYAMRFGEAPPMWGRFFYRRIVAPRSIHLISCFSNAAGGITRAPFFDGKWPMEMQSGFAFEDVGGGKTRLTVTWLPLGASQEEADTFESNHESMTGGWTGTLDQLADYLTAIGS